MSKKILGVDVGGTTIKIGLLSTDGDIFDKWEIPTNTYHAGSTILSDAWNAITDRLSTADILRNEIIGIGVGVPGFVNAHEGIVYEAVNIGWKNINVMEELHDLSGLPVWVANDANTAMLGENWLGSGNQAKNVLAVTLGTGIGGGIIANGDLINGENGTAGEIGHMTIDANGFPCNCGRKGCLETVASATGIVRQAEAAIKQNPGSNLAAFYTEKGEITAKDIFDRAENGDGLCRQIMTYTMDVLGFSLANIATVLNPSKILIGGGVANAGAVLINGIQTFFEKYALPRINESCAIKGAELGNDAGIIGAAFLVKQQLFRVSF